MEKKFEITFSYWKEKELGYFDALPDLDIAVKHIIQSKIVKANTKEQAEEHLQSVYDEPLRIIKTKEIKQREIMLNGR